MYYMISSHFVDDSTENPYHNAFFLNVFINTGKFLLNKCF